MQTLTLVDNYDSFVHTLARYAEELGAHVRVVRNDAATLEDLATSTAVLLSPGPCGPAEAGICLEAVRRLPPTLPILGVCLGHQAIVEACGGRVEAVDSPTHGRASLIEHDGRGVFDRVPSPCAVGRYHSLAAVEVPEDLVVSARLLSADGEPARIMAVRHRSRPLAGVQFHPESVLTPIGRRVLWNFLQSAGFDGLVPAPGLDATSRDVTPSEAMAGADAGAGLGATSSERSIDRPVGLPAAAEPTDFYARPLQPAYPLPSGRDGSDLADR